MTTASDRYGAEVGLVEYLIEEVSDTLTDRRGSRHGPPWSPEQNVRVGVLRPRIVYWQPERGTAETPDDAAQADATTTDTELSDSDVIGVDFTTTTDNDHLQLEVNVAFTLYQPEFPTFKEALQILQGETDTHDSSLPGSGGRTKAKRAKPIPLHSAWRRYPIQINNIQLALPLDGSHVTVSDPIDNAVQAAVQAHFQHSDAARPLTGRGHTVHDDALQDRDAYRGALTKRVDTSWKPEYPDAELTCFAEWLPGNQLLVSVSLTNQTRVEGRSLQNFALYDCRLEVHLVEGGTLVRQRFNLAPDDYRYAEIAVVAGHGRNCVAVDVERGVGTETLPLYRQEKVVSRTGHVPTPKWLKLADSPMPILAGVSQAMRAYDNDWGQWLATQTSADVRKQSEIDRQGFRAEIDRFEIGVSALSSDTRLLRAFKLANRAFEALNTDKPYDSWRLFQLVYIVSQLPALAARGNRNVAKYRDELDYVDVLWFPTGGGKTEAYLGLIVVGAFYDRLRGKSAGVTAWLKFPLRMLSVQQLVRVMRVLVAAECIREEEMEGMGAPFDLGYLVGGRNTPNMLRYSSSWWPGFAAAVQEQRKDVGAFDKHRLVGECPFCGSKDRIGLQVDTDRYRLTHVCRSCKRELPIYITDDEVYRYQPTVVVSTIDKVTGFSHYGEFTTFSRGPEGECPKHGYFAFGGCSVRLEKDTALTCTIPATSYKSVSWEDPVPAITLQDELHLVREELGVFDAHFEGLVAELQRGGPSGLPSKILAATATIEQFHDQLRQVYGRWPRRFPSPGYELGRSFYVDTLPEHQRVFLGVMPTGSGVTKVEVAAKVQRTLISVIHRLQNDLDATRQLILTRSGRDLPKSEVAALLFDYEVSLGFVNSKAHGAMIADELRDLSAKFVARGEHPVRNYVLTGEVGVPELAETIALIEDSTLAVPRAERLRAIVGTSVVSHGVDLERLNLMVMSGLPPTTADYIQATSRSGRVHLGLVVTVVDRFQRRESSTFSHFVSTHQLLDILVAPVPVNRYAHRAVERTLPSIVAALLWDLCRGFKNPGPREGVRYTRYLRPWWNSEAANGLDAELLERLRASYQSCVQGVNPAGLEDQLSAAATNRWEVIERSQMQEWDADKMVDLFRVPVMTSLRDVNVPIEFGATVFAKRIYRAMYPERQQ